MEDRRDKDIDGDASHLPDDANADRRKFLAVCGRFSVVTPPAITLLLSTSLTSQAIAHSGAREFRGDRDRDDDWRWRDRDDDHHRR